MADDLVRVAVAHDGAEAEMIAGLLTAEGIPSMLVRSGGFDFAGFLAAGPRDVMDPAATESKARELLGTQDHD